MRFNVLVNTSGQLRAALECTSVTEIYAEADVFNPSVIGHCHAAGKQCITALPYIFRDGTQIKPEGYDGILVRSLDELAYCRGGNLIADYGLYAMNPVAGEFLREQGIRRLTAPAELNEHELKALGMQDKELIIYGHLPMMVSAQCIRKNTAGCVKKSVAGAGCGNNRTEDLRFDSIIDRRKNRLPVENKCAYCYNLIYNPVPLSLFGVMPKVEALRPASLRISFTVETEQEARKILNDLADPAEFTRGHFTRGVE